MFKSATFLVLFTLALGVSSTARAECPWEGEITSATATMTTVTINGQLFSVKGGAQRAQFAAVLSKCGVNSVATQSFIDWRSMRRATNITGVVGVCCVLPVLIGTGVAAILAGEKRDEMLMALMASGQ